MNTKKAQISMEYLIMVSFVVFIVLSLLGLALFYSSEITDTIKSSQVERFANELTDSAESVYYSGEPSKLTITGFVPAGVNSIEIKEKEIIFNISTSSGVNLRSFSSNVPLTGALSPTEGMKKIKITAESDKVVISQ